MTDMKQIYEQIVIGAMITSANQPSIYRFIESNWACESGIICGGLGFWLGEMHT